MVERETIAIYNHEHANNYVQTTKLGNFCYGYLPWERKPTHIRIHNIHERPTILKQEQESVKEHYRFHHWCQEQPQRVIHNNLKETKQVNCCMLQGAHASLKLYKFSDNRLLFYLISTNYLLIMCLFQANTLHQMRNGELPT